MRNAMKSWRTILTIAVAALLAAVQTHAQVPRNSFSVVLLVGDTQGPSSLENLPSSPGIHKALNDVKDFLPYRSYRVLDTQWLRSGMTHMNGADGQDYEVTVEAGEFMRVKDGGVMPFDPSSGKPSVLVINFHLQESGAATIAGEEYARSVQAAELDKQRAALKAQLTALREQVKKDSDAMVQEMEARIKRIDAQIRLARARKLLDSHFEMAPGETVVVGTSKIGGGDKALVVLLTAVASGGK